MSFWEKENDEYDEENEDDDDEEFKSSKDRIIFLIDARLSMKETNAKGESHLKNCLHVALEVMKTKIVAQDAAAVGVMFFGSREKDSPESMDGVYTLCPLAPPSAEMIRKVKYLVNNDISVFDGMIGSQGIEKRSCPLKQALWACSQMFSTKDLKKIDFKRVWIFTNDDNPNVAYPIEQKATVTVAKDCAEAGIEISLWHLNSLTRIFNPKIFYESLLLAATTLTPEEKESQATTLGEEGEEALTALDNRMVGAGCDGFDALITAVKRKEYRKRRLCRFYFSFGFPEGFDFTALLNANTNNTNNTIGSQAQPIPNTQASATTATGTTATTGAPTSHVMGIQLYKLFNVTKRPYHTWLYGRNNQPLKSSTKYFIERTGEYVTNERIQTYLDVAGTRVAMNSEEMKELKSAGNVIGGQNIGMRFLACLPKAEFPIYELNVESPYFIYPDESMMKGSNALFECFVRECITQELIPIVRFNRLPSTAPRLAALLPQLEILDEDQSPIQPIGFHVITLPFVDEIRFNPYQGSNLYDKLFTATTTAASNNIPKEQQAVIPLVDELIEAFSLPKDFIFWKEWENPSLQQFYTVLQTIALNEEELEWQAARDDRMKPDGNVIAQVEATTSSSSSSDGVVHRLKQALGWSEEGDEVVESGGKKRAPAGTTVSSITIMCYVIMYVIMCMISLDKAKRSWCRRR